MDATMMAAMGDMGGMDMSADGMFFATNTGLAHLYWYLIAGFLSLCLAFRIFRALDMSLRKRRSKAKSLEHPTRPRNVVSQVFETCVAIHREISYPQLLIVGRKSFNWLNPPPLGRVIILLTYWVVIIALLTSGSIVNDAYYWERIGFRGAWISVTQVPLVYLLASKVSIPGKLSGRSFDRLNWLHRWVSRTLLVTVTVHGWFFFAEWYRADFVATELALMPMVKYGLGAWGVLVWTVLSSLAPLRRVAYKFFVLQHIAAAVTLLCLLYYHVPNYAVYNIWLAVGVFAFDRVARFAWTAYQNLPIRDRNVRKSQLLGYDAEISALPGNISLLTLRNVAFNWKPGQFFYLWIPKMGILDCHPFTVANIHNTSSPNDTNDANFVIQAHSGLTKRMHQKAVSAKPNELLKMWVIVTGPFGQFPVWNAFETLVLIAGGTGASFTLPILQSVLQDPGCVKSIEFLLLVHQQQEAEYYCQQLVHLQHYHKAPQLSLRQRIAVSQGDVELTTPIESVVPIEEAADDAETSQRLRSFSDPTWRETWTSEEALQEKAILTGGRPISTITYVQGKVNLADIIRVSVEECGGETSIAVCGGMSLVADVKNTVARLSDERAVYKGTDAQGIHLYVEEYAF